MLVNSIKTTIVRLAFTVEALLNQFCAKVHKQSRANEFVVFTKTVFGLLLLLLQDEGLPDVAIGSGNQKGNVPDVAMNADQQDGFSSQEPFYSSLNTTKLAVKVASPVTTAGGDYAKLNQVR